jgi:hypothetical protein
MPKAFDGTPSAYLGYGRYFLALPAAAWFLGYVWAETSPTGPVSPRTTTRLVLGIAMIGLASFVGREVTFDTRLRHITTVAELPTAGAVLHPVRTVFESCRLVTNAARRADTDLVVYRFDRAGAYGCGAIEYGTLETVFPLYGRRTWIVHREDVVLRTSFVITEADAALCTHARRLAIVHSCTLDQVTPTLAIMRTAPAPAIEVWRQLGEKVRPFDAPHRAVLR